MSPDVGVVFDLDGTLIDSAPAIAEIANILMGELALPPLSAADARGYIGNGAEVFLERALKARDAYWPQTFDGNYGRFSKLYADAPGDANVAMPGVNAALRELAEAGCPLALCTNKPMAPTLVVMEALGWGRVFHTIVAGDTLAERKPHPAPLLHAAERLKTPKVVYVGDSEVDAATAEAANIPFLLYTKGYRHTDVANIKHAHAFDDMAALAGIVLLGEF